MDNKDNNGRGIAIASLVLGGVSLGLAFVPFASFLGFASGIVGLVLSIKAKKMKYEVPDKYAVPVFNPATVGLVLSIVGLAFSFILSIAYTICICGTCNAYNSTLAGLSDYSNDILNSYY